MLDLSKVLCMGLVSGLASAHPNGIGHILPRATTATVTKTVTQTLTVYTASSCSTAAPTTSPSSPKPAAVGPTQQGSLWNVPGVGLFSKKALYTFEGSQLPDGLQASVYKVDDVSGGAPFNHQFVANNVQVSGGNLNLLVPGPQSTKGAGLKCAEITTTESKILYGSVRTVAMFSQVEGTCHGTYKPTFVTSHADLSNFRRLLLSQG